MAKATRLMTFVPMGDVARIMADKMAAPVDVATARRLLLTLDNEQRSTLADRILSDRKGERK